MRIGVINTNVRDEFDNKGKEIIYRKSKGPHAFIVQTKTSVTHIDFCKDGEDFAKVNLENYMENQCWFSLSEENGFSSLYKNFTNEKSYDNISSLVYTNFVSYYAEKNMKIKDACFYEEKLLNYRNKNTKKRKFSIGEYGWAINFGKSDPYWKLQAEEVEEKVYNIFNNKNILNKNQYVYTIKLRDKYTKEPWYYVGVSKNPSNRIKDHATKNYKCTTNKILLSDVIEIEACKNREHAEKREREKFFEIVQEKQTDKVLGGR